MSEKETLAFNLKRLRQFKGLTQEDLAKKIGLTKDTISKIELGKQENVGFKYLTSICRELDVGLEEMFMDGPNYIPLKIVVSDKNVETLKNMFDKFMRILGDKKK